MRPFQRLGLAGGSPWRFLALRVGGLGSPKTRYNLRHRTSRGKRGREEERQARTGRRAASASAEVRQEGTQVPASRVGSRGGGRGRGRGGIILRSDFQGEQ